MACRTLFTPTSSLSTTPPLPRHPCLKDAAPILRRVSTSPFHVPLQHDGGIRLGFDECESAGCCDGCGGREFWVAGERRESKSAGITWEAETLREWVERGVGGRGSVDGDEVVRQVDVMLGRYCGGRTDGFGWSLGRGWSRR